MPDQPDTRARLGIPCRGPDRDYWHSTRPDEIAQAIESCSWCPVLDWCKTTQLAREQALGPYNRWGVWAGVLIDPLLLARHANEPPPTNHLHLVPAHGERLTTRGEHMQERR